MLFRSLYCRYTVCAASLLFVPLLLAQTATQEESSKLLHRPLYLRDAWTEDKISFDSTGKPTTPAHHGPLTLSGIDITSVKVSGKTLQLRGQRVALISSGPGEPLQRVGAISSITSMPLTMQKRYVANEPVQFTVLAGNINSFAAPLAAIFADGLPQLASSVQPYWRFYAATYFVSGTLSTTAKQDVLQCAKSQSHLAVDDEDGITPVEILQSIPPHFTNAAAMLGVSGTASMYATINANGTPSNFQVISAIGAGLDESLLQAVSQFTFKAATKSGISVRSYFEYDLNFETQ